MSSTYRVLCLSHDPAIECGEYQRPETAEAAIAEGITDHADCDLVIGRYSYPLVELGCPRTARTTGQPTPPRPNGITCCHGSTVWVDRDWLWLLAAAYQSPDPDMRVAIEKGHAQQCLPWERLRRLRNELDFTVKERQLLRGEDGRFICTCTYDTPCGCGTSVLYETKERSGA